MWNISLLVAVEQVEFLFIGLPVVVVAVQVHSEQEQDLV
jgi:hypothetical protein